MRQITVHVDDWTLQEAAAALDTSTVAETIHRALAVATEVERGRRLAARRRRLSSRLSALGAR